MFGPKLDSKSYTTFLLIVIGVLLSLNLFAQINPPIRDPAVDERYDSTAVYREVAVSNQAVASATTQVAASNQQIAQALNAIANAIDAKSQFDVNVTMSEDGGTVRRPAGPVTMAPPAQPAPLNGAPVTTPVTPESRPDSPPEESGRIQLR